MSFDFTKKSSIFGLSKYGLASAMFIAAAPAQAGLIYSGPINTTVNSPGTLLLDLDGDFTNEFQLTADVFTDPIPGAEVLIGTLGTNGVTGVTQGTVIDQNLTYDPSYSVVKSVFIEGPQSASVVAGLRFDIDGTTHYGWMRVSGYADSGGGISSAVLHDFAYEDDANTAVVAPSAVPEPSSLALFVLGAAGVAALKRRRAA